MITKATDKEIQDIMDRYKIIMNAVITYNKCYIKDGVVIANKGISVLLRDKDGKVYAAQHGEKYDKDLEFLGAVQNIQHPEQIVFIL